MRMEADDIELLRDYVRSGSDSAFRTLVERHINLVYHVALRQTQNAQSAQDVTQAVFIALAEKAATIPQKTVLAGWLFRATRFAAANICRAEARREHWEQKAAQMEPTSSTEPDLEPVAPLLNEALEQLPEIDRAAILLRFFESKSMEEIGRKLGTTEDAAKMRLYRAVVKLRNSFRRRGVVVPTATVLALLSAQAAQAAPTGLAAAIATSALLNQSSTSTALLAKGTLKIMAQAKIKKLAITALIVLFGGVTAVVVTKTITKREPAPVVSNSPGTQTAVPPPVTAATSATKAATGKILVFRNRPSWNRQPDFEDAMADMGLDFEVKPAELMASTDLSGYRAIIIPGSQSTSQFYDKYTESAARFDEYVTNGGTLVLELNGAERSSILMPRGVNMILNPALDNAITLPAHPIV